MIKYCKSPLLALMLLIPGMPMQAASHASGLSEMLDKARSENYVVPSSLSIMQAQNGFKYWFAAENRLKAAEAFDSPGFKSLGFEWVGLESDIVVLTEQESARFGRGLFAARIQGGRPLLIQAPHQYADLRTGRIAHQLFHESNAMAAAWNTTHRYFRDNSDLVHISDSYLHALSRAFSELYPDGLILQLHGFSRDLRKSRAGRNAQAILSDGSRYPPKALGQMTECLSQGLKIRALLYPRDVRELGATTNTVGVDLRHRGFDGFVHLELDAELRKRLVKNANDRKILIQCVMESLI